MFADAAKLAKSTNIFFRERFLMYSILRQNIDRSVMLCICEDHYSVKCMQVLQDRHKRTGSTLKRTTHVYIQLEYLRELQAVNEWIAMCLWAVRWYLI